MSAEPRYTEERIKTAHEVFEEVLHLTYAMKDEKDAFRKEFGQALMVEAIKTAKVLRGDQEEEIEEGHEPSVAYELASLLCVCVAIASFLVSLFLIGDWGNWWLGALGFFVAAWGMILAHFFEGVSRS